MSLSLQALKDRQIVDADWIIKGLLKRGNTAFTIGQPKKAAKSWLLLDAAWSLAEGEPLWGIKRKDGAYALTTPRPMRCVYFAQEDTDDDIHDRVLAHFRAGRDVNDRLWIVPKNLRMALDSDGGRGLIQAELDEVREKAGGPIDLVIFDPMRRMHHGDENDSTTMGRIWEVLDRIHRRYACATWFSHHTVKPPQDKTYYDPSDPYVARGSGDIYGGGDAFMTIVPGKGTETTRTLTMHFESKRGRGLMPAVLKVDFETGRAAWLGNGWKPKEQEEDTNI